MLSMNERLTPSARKMLLILYYDGHPVSYVNLRLMLNLTMRGASGVRQRLLAAEYVEMAAYNGTPRLQITEAGKRALAVHYPDVVSRNIEA